MKNNLDFIKEITFYDMHITLFYYGEGLILYFCRKIG